ncbi:MAG TPA: hypothetical protein VNG51_29415 [Ktedonobacteraceae bacterium]|nr:hypothetical protein [Ktedonobacteraceae bacterium]
MAKQFEQSPSAQSFQFQQSQQAQEVKFYKSGIFGFSSAAGRFQSDSQRMTADGWKLQYASFLGMNFWLRRVIVATYVK